MNQERCYCVRCHKDLSNIEKVDVCECGSRTFIYGNTVVLEDGKFACECGSRIMEKVGHINMNPRYISTYRCCGCGAGISVEIYYESPYL